MSKPPRIQSTINGEKLTEREKSICIAKKGNTKHVHTPNQFKSKQTTLASNLILIGIILQVFARLILVFGISIVVSISVYELGANDQK